MSWIRYQGEVQPTASLIIIAVGMSISNRLYVCKCVALTAARAVSSLANANVSLRGRLCWPAMTGRQAAI